tara:strand:- start:28 stop:750 length:723 start_codon:yes stop_codon:yes gene_type:complete
MTDFNKLLPDLPEQGYAVLDFDNTCIINDIQEAVLSYLCENSLLKHLDGQETLQKYYQLDNEHDAYEFAITILDGFTIDELKEIVKKVILAEGSEIGKRELFGVTINHGLKINQSVASLIDFLDKKGYSLYLVSASSKFVIEVAAKVFFPNYNFTSIGIENVIKDGVLTKDLVYPISTCEGKVDNIKNHISKNDKPTVAVGDSMNDAFMLEYSKFKVVVDRNNQLTDLARKNNWLILPRQ